MCTFSLPKWRARGRQGKGMKAREREGECYKCLSLRKHGVSLSLHMWICLSGQSDALMEINQSDITAIFATAQHSPPSLFLPFLRLLPLKGRRENRDIAIVISIPASLFRSLTSSHTPYLVVCPLIIKATPLIRSISPPLSRPLTPTSFTRGVRIKDGE